MKWKPLEGFEQGSDVKWLLFQGALCLQGGEQPAGGPEERRQAGSGLEQFGVLDRREGRVSADPPREPTGFNCGSNSCRLSQGLGQRQTVRPLQRLTSCCWSVRAAVTMCE